jgi:hypothetical protein
MEKSPVHKKQHRAGKRPNAGKNERKLCLKVKEIPGLRNPW